MAPSALLIAIGDRLSYNRTASASTLQIAYFLLTITAVICLILGLGAVELLLLRYFPAWYDLPACSSAREAMRLSRRHMRGQLGSAVWLHLRYWFWLLAGLLILPGGYTMPLFFTARSLWIETLPNEDAEANVYFDCKRKNCKGRNPAPVNQME